MVKCWKSLFLILFSVLVLPSRVAAQVQVPFTMDESTFFSESVSFKNGDDDYLWSNDAIRMSTDGILSDGCGFCWPDRYFTVEISGAPDVISFSTSTSSVLCTYKLGYQAWELEQSADGKSWSTVWGSKSQSNTVSEQLDKNTRFVRLHDRFNYSGYVKNFSISSCHYVKYRSEGKIIAEFGPFRKGESLANVTSSSPEKDCYSFKGWNKVLPANMGDSDIILDAQFEKIQYNSVINLSEELSDVYDMSFYCGETVFVQTPSREGFSFDGWSPALPSVATEEMDGAVFSARWSRNTYVFRYVNGVDTLPLNVAYEAAIPSVENPSKEGCSFMGWSPDVPEEMPSHDVLVDAVWQKNRYLLTIRLFEDSVWTDSVEYGAVGSLPVPERKGFSFEGWENLPSVMPAHDVEVSALWTPNFYRLSVVVAHDTVPLGEYRMGELVSVEDAPSVTGYTIIGWTPSLPDFMPDYDLTLSAILKPNRHLLTVWSDSVAIFADSVDYDSNIDMDVLAPSDSAGFLFEWISPSIESMPDSDVVLYGTFVRQSYPLKIYDGQMVWKDTIYWYGDTIRMDKPLRKGWELLNWDELPSVMPAHAVDIDWEWKQVLYSISLVVDSVEFFSEKYVYSDTVSYPAFPDSVGFRLYWDKELPQLMPDSDLVIVGSWDEYKMLFRLVDGDETFFYSYYHEGELLPSFDSMEKEGYSFLDWSPELPSLMPDSDFVSMARWSKNRYPLTLTVDGAVVLDTMLYYHDTIDVSLFPMREGYSLSGDTCPLLMPAQPLSLTFVWGVNNHRLVMMDGDSVVLDSLLAYGEEIVWEPITKEGYTFDGWIPSLPERMPDSGIVVHAQWSVVFYPLIVKTETETLIDTVYAYLDTINPNIMPVKKGYSLLLSRELPAVMPAEPIEVIASWKVMEFRFELKSGEETVVDSMIPYGQEIAWDDLDREGYTFEGWSPELPATMPDSDFVSTALWKVGRYHLVIMSETDTLKVSVLDYGEEIIVPEDPYREGTRFEWLDTFPSLMPARDVVVGGRFVPLLFPFVAIVDGDTVMETTYAFGDLIGEVPVPDKEGYSFAGWEVSVPEYMPAYPLILEGKRKIDMYSMRFFDEDVCVWDTIVEFGALLPASPELQKEGYSFTGWDTLVEVMPSHDVEAHANWKVNQYSITLMLVSVTTQKMLGLPQRLTFSYGEKVDIQEFGVDGYRFSGWNNECPETMPAKNFALIALMEPLPNVVGEDKIEDEGFQVYVKGREISVFGRPQNSDLILFDLSGRVEFQGRLDKIEVEQAGTYLVSVGGYVTKVVVK